MSNPRRTRQNHRAKRVRSNKPTLRPAFQLTKRTQQASLQTPTGTPTPEQNLGNTKPANAKQDPRKQVAKTTPSTAKKDTPRFVTLRSIPSATVFRLGQEVGVTPYKVRLDKKRHMMTLKAKGYADTDVKVDSNTPSGTKTVILKETWLPHGARQTVSEHHLHRRGKGWAWGPRETSGKARKTHLEGCLCRWNQSAWLKPNDGFLGRFWPASAASSGRDTLKQIMVPSQ